MSKEDGLFDGVYWAGGASVCITGAKNEHKLAGGGRMLQYFGHVIFIPPNASPNDLVGNAGVEYDEEGNIINPRFYTQDLTVGEALKLGLRDITADVLKFSRKY